MTTRTRRAQSNAGPPVSGDDDSEFPPGAAMPLALPAGEGVDFLDDEPPPEQSAADRVLAILSEADENDARAVVKLFRKPANGGKQAWCDDYSPADFEAGGLKMIRTKWGAGEYVVCLYGGQPGTKRFVLRGRAEIKIEPGAEPVEPTPANGIAHAGPLADVLRTIAEGQATMLRALTERQHVDPMADIAKMFTVMKGMREAMGDDKPQRNSLKDALEAVQLLRESSELVAPQREPESDSLTGILKHALPMIANMAQANAQKAGAAPALPLGPPLAMAPAEGHPSTNLEMSNQSSEGQEMGILNLGAEALAAVKLRAFVHQLMTWAKADGEDKSEHVERAATLVADKLPDELLEVLELEEWFPMLCTQVPDAAAHPQWLAKVRDRALAMLDEPDGDGDGDGDGGDANTAPPRR